MIFNISARILKNLLLYNIDNFIFSKYKDPEIAVSPIMIFDIGHETEEVYNCIELNLKSTSRNYSILIFIKNIKQTDLEEFRNYLKNTLLHTSSNFSILFKKRYNVSINEFKKTVLTSNEELLKDIFRIDITISINEHPEVQISIILPIQFLRLFSKKIKSSFSSEDLEKEINGFFKNPLNIFPDLRTILETFNHIDLQKLLYQLQKKNLLTIYQLCLMVLSFPELSLKLKKNLSSNTVQDILDMMRRVKSNFKITKRDLIEGIYSIEESIFFLMRENIDFSYSAFLSDLKNSLKMISNLEFLLMKNFVKWVEQIQGENLLYKTLSITNENITAIAISEEPELYERILKKYISERKVKDIISLINYSSISPIERVMAQAEFISNYRKLKFGIINLGDESFEFLLRKISRPNDYNNLLINIGWYTVSTALKGIESKYTKNFLINIPEPARFLIEDVLRGIINPNIIHDDIQKRKARSICVETIISLYEEGSIFLVD